jgi:hypothetical protein
MTHQYMEQHMVWMKPNQSKFKIKELNEHYITILDMTYISLCVIRHISFRVTIHCVLPLSSWVIIHCTFPCMTRNLQIKE